jgi:hypothetical protein
MKDKTEKAYEDKFTLLAGFGFLLAATARGFYIVLDYYIMIGLFRYLAWGCLILGVVIILISVFRGVPSKIFKNFPHKYLYLFSIVVFLTLLILFRLINEIVFYIAMIPIGVILTIPLISRFIRWISKVGGYIKRYFVIAGFAIPLAFVGIGIGSVWQSLPEYEGWLLKISSHLCFLISLILLSLALWNTPSVVEFGWQDKLDHLYVLIGGGLLAYEHSFKASKEVDSDLLSSSLAGIVDIVKEMTKSEKPLKIIKQEKKNIYLEQGKFVTVVILAEQELKILLEKIRIFTKQFEITFSSYLEHWNGNTDTFKIADVLIESLFTMK